MATQRELEEEGKSYLQELLETGSVAFMPRDQFHMIYMVHLVISSAQAQGKSVDIETGLRFIRLISKTA